MTEPPYPDGPLASRRAPDEQLRQLASAIFAAGDQLDGLRTAIAALRDRADQIHGAGLVSLNLERALISLTAANRELVRAYDEVDR